jgi:hypothetical protein
MRPSPNPNPSTSSRGHHHHHREEGFGSGHGVDVAMEIMEEMQKVDIIQIMEYKTHFSANKNRYQ